MVYFEKSQPAPTCLTTEKTKKSGDYKCGDVLERLNSDFKGKCYICEQKGLTSINVEHFVPHKDDKNLKFDWNNLFWSCSHCNNTKLDKHSRLLDCTNIADDVENKLTYAIDPLSVNKVQIDALDDSIKTSNTKELLLAVYNGTTKLKKIESANLRQSILEELQSFQELLLDYFEEGNSEERLKRYEEKIQGHLSNTSRYTSFKRQIVATNARFKAKFEKYFK